MKKVLSVCVPLVLLLAVLSLPVFANETADIVFSLSNVTGWAGGTVKVPLTVGESSASYNAVGLALEYDPDPQTTEGETTLPDGITFEGFDFKGCGFASKEEVLAECYSMGGEEYLGDFDVTNKAIVLALDTNGDIGGKTICNLVFKVAEGTAKGDITVGLHAVVMNDSTELTTSVTPATITVGDQPAGVEVGGTFTSYGVDADTTIKLIKEGATDAAYTATVRGTQGTTSANAPMYTGTWAIETVEPGKYTVEVFKTKHRARTYQIEVIAEPINLDVAIWLVGDVYLDGKVNSTDSGQIIRYSTSKSSIFSHGSEDDIAYRLLVGDVYVDGKVNSTDSGQIIRYSTSKTSVFNQLP